MYLEAWRREDRSLKDGLDLVFLGIIVPPMGGDEEGELDSGEGDGERSGEGEWRCSRPRDSISSMKEGRGVIEEGEINNE